jgi:RNA polymerase sigma-70 factor (ECF subfamily)
MEGTIHISRKLIERCLLGDIKAQYQLYLMYSRAMYNIAIRILNNKMDAEDILQESFVKAFERLGDLKDKDLFAGWLKRIVINNCISLQRKRKMIFEEIDENHCGEAEEPDEGMQEVDPAVVHHAIRELPDRGRAVLVLRALEGYSHKEIAEALGITVSTSKTQYSRCLSLLQKKLKANINVSGSGEISEKTAGYTGR